MIHFGAITTTIQKTQKLEVVVCTNKLPHVNHATHDLYEVHLFKLSYIHNTYNKNMRKGESAYTYVCTSVPQAS